jgi:hypothetical protein
VDVLYSSNTWASTINPSWPDFNPLAEPLGHSLTFQLFILDLELITLGIKA